MAVINNVPHTTYTVDEGMFGGADITLNCETGFNFVSAPTVTYTDNQFGETKTVAMTLNAKKTTATYSNEEVDTAQDITFNGSVQEPQPIAPNNNVAHTSVLMEMNKVTLTCESGYVFDGSPKITFDDDPFADEVTMTVSQDGKTATYSQDKLGEQQITISGNTKAEPVPEPVVTNNVPNTTVNVSGNTVTLTCADGYIFDGTPSVTIGSGAMADELPMTVSENGKVATLTNDGVGSNDLTITGNTKTEPVVPVVTNNVAHTTFQVSGDTVTLTCQEGYIFDGTPTVTIGSDPFAEGTPMTVSGDLKTATLTAEGVGSNDLTIEGNTKTEPVAPVVTNNVAHTTVEVSGDTVTLTCETGYIFDGTPVVTKTNDPMADEMPMTVSGDLKTATLTSQGIGSTDITITGNTKVEPEPVPDPVVTNNITGASETHTKDGDTALTINLTSNKMMRNVTVGYTNVSGETVSLPVTVVPDIKPERVVSSATVSLTDVDFHVAVVLSGEAKDAIGTTFTLSGCKASSEPPYIFLGEPLSLTLTADDGNEFADPSKVYYEFEGAFSGGENHPFTIAEDKLTATATIVTNTDIIYNTHLIVIAEAQQKVIPTAKYGFINAYVVTEDNLNVFATSRFIQYTGGGSTQGDPVNYDLGDYVNRVKRYFFKVDEGTTSKLKCGNFIVDTDVKNLASDRKTLDFGQVAIPNYTQSAADYSTDVIMFVPFIGLVNVGSEIIGKTVNLTLRVNVLSGGGVYVLTCEGNIVWTKEVDPCTDVIYRTTAQDPKVIGGVNFDATYLMGLRPYVLVDRREIVNNGSQSSSSRVTRIGDLTGNVKLTDVVFSDTENMLQLDIDEIVSILRQGISL